MYNILFKFDNDLQARALEYFCVSLFGSSHVYDEWFDSDVDFSLKMPDVSKEDS